jgi:hypothetical protein
MWLIACAGLAACSRACGDPVEPAAVLLEISGGPVERQRGAGAAWETLALGGEVATDDQLRTDGRSRAKLRFPDGSELWLQAGSQLRLLKSDHPDERHIDLVTGEALIKSGAKTLKVRTQEGVASVQSGGSLALTRSGKALQLYLQVGEAQFRRESGEEVLLKRGERVRLEIGVAVIRDGDAADPQPADALRLRVAGAGARVREPGKTAFVPLPPGERSLAPATILSLPAGVSSALLRDLDQIELFGAGEYAIGGGAPLITTDRGTLQVLARSRDVHLAVPGGFIVARAAVGGSECEVRIDARSGELRVKRGEVLWKSGGREQRVLPGVPLQFTVPERAPAQSESGDQQPPPHISLAVRAGESFVVHAAELPVAVGVQVEQACTGDALVELNGGLRWRAAGSVGVWLNEAARNYSVRCLDAEQRAGPVAARGGARVLRDAGTRELPPTPPTSVVDADGRSYTIYYQNQRPDIRVRWPSAPTAGPFQLAVDARVLTSKAPEYTFASGDLGDGSHKLTFSASERRSRTTNIDVRFDNTASTASLSAPADRSFTPGADVGIEGVALPTWKVSVDGGTIQKDNDGRFHGRIVTTESQPDFAVRLSHPRLGNHYYVRRASPTP